MTATPLTFGSLFAGIGGMDLGLERAGLECRWQVEIDPHARRVLAKHWPDVRRHDDVNTFPPSGRPADWAVDLIAGGFPCQDISHAGAKAGIDGERSGLWTRFGEIIRDLRPRYVLVENASALLDRGICRVLGDLARLGFDAEWSIVSACSVGAPHLRERVFILAYPNSERPQGGWPQGGRDVPSVARRRVGVRHLQAASWPGGRPRGTHWEDQPRVGRVADGVPAGVDRLKRLGNAVVPQVAEFVGRRLIEFHEAIERKGEGR